MPRRRPLGKTFFPQHITARSINKESFFIPLPDVWDIMTNHLFFLHHSFNIELLAFLLMPNHFHLIARSPESNLSEAMNYFMRETSKAIGRSAGRINQIYGARYHRSEIDSYRYFTTAYKYLYRNPVRSGLCNQVEEYPYSTLPGLLGLRPLHIPLQPDALLFAPNFSQETLNWLNQPTPPEIDEQIRRALRRKKFEFPNHASGKRFDESSLETCPSPLDGSFGGIFIEASDGTSIDATFTEKEPGTYESMKARKRFERLG